MIPLRDTTKPTLIPFVNISLITINICVFIYGQLLIENTYSFILTYGLIPKDVFAPSVEMSDRVYPFFSSMFLHGGWLHLIGNTLFLYIFGANVESRMGHVKYIMFYVICGLAAAAFQIITSLNSGIPVIGASGAISGILGAYITFFPRSKILTVVPIFFFIKLIYIPASIFIFVWFIIQFISGVGSLGTPQDTGGIAFWAHIGGFVTGLILARFFDNKPLLKIEETPRYYH